MIRRFVTGTDTGVGKTRVTALLAALARQDGRRVLACKAVASGVVEPPGEDAVELGLAAGHSPLALAWFRDPVSPHRAARAEGRVVPDLTAQVRALWADVVLVEGVGGWMAPLGTRPLRTGAELAAATGPDVVVVAANRLGVLNHALLTLRAVRADGFRVVAVVLNDVDSPAGDASRASNLDDLREVADAPVIPVPILPPGVVPAHVAADLRRVIVDPTDPP